MYQGRVLLLLALWICEAVCVSVLSGDEGDEGEGSVSYHGYSVLKLTLKSEEDKNWIEKQECQVLSESVLIRGPILMLCDRYKSENLEKAAIKEGINVKYISRDLGKEIQDEANTSNERKREFKHQRYLGSQPMYGWLQNLAENLNCMKMETIGKTGEGRDIQIVKINSANNNLPIIFVDAGIHAREWISPAATLYLIERLAKTVERGDKTISKFQWHIIPLANPDGYEYSRTKDRMWRKNTVKNPGSKCKGVDLNRNFPLGYGIGASKNPCSEVFKGSEPLSEQESIAISNYITNTSNIKAAVSIHSYGSDLIYPWGYLKKKQHPRRKQLRSLANKMRKAILKKTGEKYEIGTTREVFGAWGVCGGATDDWYITQNIDYSYTFELPETDNKGDHGFLLPAKNIIKVGKQLLVGFTAMASRFKKE